MTPLGAPFERGYRLGKYEVIGRISVGGMAELYLAFLTGQGGFKKFVALKRVLPSVAEQASFLKMFLDEARITASLSHANIAQVFELAEDPNNQEPVLAMEFVAGQNLAQVVKRAHARGLALPPAFSCRVVHDALLGLHSAHHFVEPTSGRPMPVIHRDVNPRNVMVTYTGGTKVIDFGIAKARGRLDTTQVGMVKGTLRYMSPEQVMQQPLDGRSDLFAASVVLYELLAGRRLFDEDSDAALLNRVVQADVRPLGEVAPAVPRAVADAVMKGLSRTPEDRWRSGRDYARALDQALPELFDDEQVAELMGRLFEDTIAVTRALLQSTTSDASYANLELMVTAAADSRPSLPPRPIDEVPTASARRVNDAPPPSTAATMVIDQPVAAPATDRTEAALDPVAERAPAQPAPADAADERPTAPDRPVLKVAPPGAAEAKPTPGAAPPPRKRTLDGQPSVRKATQEAMPARKPTSDRVLATPARADGALLPVRRATADAQLLAPVAETPVAPVAAKRSGGLVVVLVVLGLAVLGAVGIAASASGPDPETPRPVPMAPTGPSALPRAP